MTISGGQDYHSHPKSLMYRFMCFVACRFAHTGGMSRMMIWSPMPRRSLMWPIGMELSIWNWRQKACLIDATTFVSTEKFSEVLLYGAVSKNCALLKEAAIGFHGWGEQGRGVQKKISFNDAPGVLLVGDVFAALDMRGWWKGRPFAVRILTIKRWKCKGRAHLTIMFAGMLTGMDFRCWWLAGSPDWRPGRVLWIKKSVRETLMN